MSWKNWPSWLKGGVIGAGVCLGPSFLFMLYSVMNVLGYGRLFGGNGLVIIFLLFFPFGFLATIFLKTTNFFDFYIEFILLSILINFIIGFFIGSIIGGIIRKLSYTIKGFFVGVIISAIIIFFMFFDCFFNLENNSLRCIFSTNLTATLWMILSVIICLFIGFIIGKLKSQRKKK